MAIKGSKFGYWLPLWMLIPITVCLLWGCSSDDSKSEPTQTPVKFSLLISCPQMESEIQAYSSEGAEVDTRFYSRFNDDASYQVLARQNGDMIDLGEFRVKKTSNDGAEGRLDVDASGKLSAGKPYDIYIIGGSYRWDESNLYYKKKLTRSGGFSTWLKLNSTSIPSKASDNMTGTGEILFVINKSGSPIKFKHKGFDVEEKWYYSYAEVSVDNGKVVNAENGSEVEGVECNVPVFTGKNTANIYSFYVPNGNKIQNAQLIAEIDGKEVRSVNRISSDIEIQPNRSYAMFAVWDGEKLTLGDENGEDTVIDLTDAQKSGIKVTSVEGDGTMTIEATEAKAPHVGDYLCSGPTDLAPYGYLLRVTEITKKEQSESSTRSLDDIKKHIWLLKTTAAAVNEVFKNLDINYPIDLRDISIDEVTDNEGHTISMTEEQKNKWKIPIPALKAEFLTLSPEISFSPKQLSFHLQIQDHKLNTFGVKFETEMETKVHLDATFRNKKPIEKSFDIYHVFLKPIVIPETPIVITPLFQIFLSFTGNAKAVFSITPIHEIYDVSIGAQYNGKTNAIEPTTGDDFIQMEERYADKDRGIDNMETSFTLDGNAKVSLGASLSFGLCGCNYMDRVSFFKGKFDLFDDLLSADFWIDLNREAKAKVEISFNDIESYWDNSDFHFTDECSWTNYAQLHAQFYARIFNPITRKFVGYQPEIKSKEIEFWPEKLFPSLFVTDFKDLKITPQNNRINLSADKYRPFFGYSMFNEIGLGFRYASCDSNGKITGEWAEKDLLSNYSAGYPDLFKYKMETNIPMNTFEKDKYYFVYPFVRVSVPNNSVFSQKGSYYIHRKGRIIKLADDGSVVENELPNIPGMDL